MSRQYLMLNNVSNGIRYTPGKTIHSVNLIEITLNDLGWLSKIFNDTKHRAAFLRQLRFLLFYRLDDAAVCANSPIHRGQQGGPGRRWRGCGDGTLRTADPLENVGPVEHPTAAAVTGCGGSDAARGSETRRQQVRRSAGGLGPPHGTDDALSGSTTTSTTRSTSSHHQTAPASGWAWWLCSL